MPDGELWLQIFAYSIYAIAAVVLVETYRRDGFFYVCLPVLFAVYFLISEVLATQGKLPYAYGALPHAIIVDADLVATLVGPTFGTLPPGISPTGEIVHGCPVVSARVPIAVPIMEALLVFGMLRTAMVLKAQRWLRPALVALVCMALDWILDPTSASSKWCGQPGYGGVEAGGVGLWHWYFWGHFEPNWQGIPLANFTAWFFGTTGIVFAVDVVEERRGRFPRSKMVDLGWLGLTLASILLLGLFLELVTFRALDALFTSHELAFQWTVVGLSFTVTAFLALDLARGFGRAERVRWEWLLMPALLMLWSLAGLVRGGHQEPQVLAAAWVGAAVLVGLYLYWPYRSDRLFRRGRRRPERAARSS